jgi:hypothetical protein
MTTENKASQITGTAIAVEPVLAPVNHKCCLCTHKFKTDDIAVKIDNKQIVHKLCWDYELIMSTIPITVVANWH